MSLLRSFLIVTAIAAMPLYVALPATAADDGSSQLRMQVAQQLSEFGFRIGAQGQLSRMAITQLYFVTSNGRNTTFLRTGQLRSEVRVILSNNGYVCDPATTEPYFCGS
jgi:hypothetical protein